MHDGLTEQPDGGSGKTVALVKKVIRLVLPTRILLVITILALGACAALSQPEIHLPASDLPVDDLLGDYALRPGVLYEIETARILIKTYRGGWLSSLAHSHVMTTDRVAGEVWLAGSSKESRAVLVFRPWDLVLDDPQERLRAGAGFESTRTAGDIAATRQRMLGPKGFDSNNHPLVSVRVDWLSNAAADLTINFRGGSYVREAQVDWSMTGNKITAEGKFSIDHSDLNIQPYSAFAGAIAVARTIDVSIQLIAGRIESQPGTAVSRYSDHQNSRPVQGADNGTL